MYKCPGQDNWYRRGGHDKIYELFRTFWSDNRYPYPGKCRRANGLQDVSVNFSCQVKLLLKGTRLKKKQGTSVQYSGCLNFIGNFEFQGLSLVLCVLCLEPCIL